MRYFFEVAYNGENYNGWQSQNNATGIQSVVENSLGKLFRETISIVASGRTDAGVHCEQQFFHADIDKTFDIREMMLRLNSFLPKDIVIKNINRVKSDASARYDAIERTYRYEITRTKNPFLNGLAWHYFKALAAAYLLFVHVRFLFKK